MQNVVTIDVTEPVAMLPMSKYEELINGGISPAKIHGAVVEALLPWFMEVEVFKARNMMSLNVPSEIKMKEEANNYAKKAADEVLKKLGVEL